MSVGRPCNGTAKPQSQSQAQRDLTAVCRPISGWPLADFTIQSWLSSPFIRSTGERHLLFRHAAANAARHLDARLHRRDHRAADRLPAEAGHLAFRQPHRSLRAPAGKALYEHTIGNGAARQTYKRLCEHEAQEEALEEGLIRALIREDGLCRRSGTEPNVFLSRSHTRTCSKVGNGSFKRLCGRFTS